jgi:hypothetical protein
VRVCVFFLDGQEYAIGVSVMDKVDWACAVFFWSIWSLTGKTISDYSGDSGLNNMFSLDSDVQSRFEMTLSLTPLQCERTQRIP